MQTAVVRRPRFGRVIIEIAPRDREGLQVTVTRTCDKPEIVELAEAVLGDLVRLSPGSVITRGALATKTATSERTGHRRGGPVGTPEDQKMKIVRGWLQMQGRMNQETFARNQGVDPSTLRRWIRQLRQEGKL